MPRLQVLGAVLGRGGARHLLHLPAVGHPGLLLLPGKSTGPFSHAQMCVAVGAALGNFLVYARR